MRKKTQLFILQWHSQNTKCKCSKAASGRWHHIFIYHAACAPSHFKLNIRYVCIIYIYDYICTQTATSDTWVSCLNTPPCTVQVRVLKRMNIEMNSLEVLGQSALSSLTALPENLLPSAVPAPIGTDLSVQVQILMQCLSNVFTWVT